jgi:MFS family permease
MSRQETVSQMPAKSNRRILFAGCLAHLTHDGLTDMLYVFFPVWQQLFSLNFSEVGLFKTLFSGSLAAFQMPAGTLGNRLGLVRSLTAGTLITCLTLAAVSFTHAIPLLALLLIVSGIGSSAQHPLASAAISRAYDGSSSRNALSTYNFVGDLGKLAFPAMAALIIAHAGWETSIRVMAAIGIIAAVLVASMLAGQAQALPGARISPQAKTSRLGFTMSKAFGALTGIGVLDSATRMGFLTFLPFVLKDKGADMPVIGLALALLFAGGAAGKLACGLLASRIGILRSVILTEAATAAGICAMVFAPLAAALTLCPFLGVALNGTSSVLYGSVPELVDDGGRNAAFAFFYTGTIGSGALSPFFYGLLGDVLGVGQAMVVTALLVLATVPLTWPLRGKLAVAPGCRAALKK